MTELDFATMIGSETGGKVRTDSVHIKDNMATLTFKEPGYFAKCLDKVTAVPWRTVPVSEYPSYNPSVLLKFYKCLLVV